MHIGLAPAIPEHQLEEISPMYTERALATPQSKGSYNNAIKIECPPETQKNQSKWKYRSLRYKIKNGIKERWREHKEYVLTLALLLAAAIVFIVVHVALVSAKRFRIAIMLTIASLMMIQLMHLVVIGAWKKLTPKSKYIYIAQVFLIAMMIVLYWVYDNSVCPALAVIIFLMSLMRGLSVRPTLLPRTRSDATLVPSSYVLDWDSMSVADDSFSRPYDPVAIFSWMDYHRRSVTGYIHMMMQKEAKRSKALEQTRAYSNVVTAHANYEAAQTNYEQTRAYSNVVTAHANYEAARANYEEVRANNEAARAEREAERAEREAARAEREAERAEREAARAEREVALAVELSVKLGLLKGGKKALSCTIEKVCSNNV